MIDRDKIYEELIESNSHGQTIEQLCDALEQVEAMSNTLNEFIDHVISEMFKSYWVGAARDNLVLARKQLYKSLSNQLEGYWSGNSAYRIMVKGGFLIDARSNEKKQLTPLGKVFMQAYRDTEINAELPEHKD